MSEALRENISNSVSNALERLGKSYFDRDALEVVVDHVVDVVNFRGRETIGDSDTLLIIKDFVESRNIKSFSSLRNRSFL